MRIRGRREMGKPLGLMDGVVRPLSAVRYVDRFVGPDVRVAEEIGGRDHDVTEHGDVVNGSEPNLRSLGVVRRFVTVSGEEKTKWK